MCGSTHVARSDGGDDRGPLTSDSTSCSRQAPNDSFVPSRCREKKSLAASRAASDRRRLACTHCGDLFYTERMLHLHERLMHTVVPPLHCSHCEVAFGHIADLNRHVLAEHTKLRKHPCGSCSNVSYPTHAQLRRHASATHQGQTPWRS
jgi:hypothetical protein